MSNDIDYGIITDAMLTVFNGLGYLMSAINAGIENGAEYDELEALADIIDTALMDSGFYASNTLPPSTD